MKKFSFLFLALFVVLSSIMFLLSFKISENPYYFSFKEKIYLKPVLGKIVVRYHSSKKAKVALTQAQQQYSGIKIKWQDSLTVVITDTEKEFVDYKSKLSEQPEVKVVPLASASL